MGYVAFVLAVLVIYLLTFQFLKDKILNEVKLSHEIPFKTFMRISWLTCINAILVVLMVKGIWFMLFDELGITGRLFFVLISLVTSIGYWMRRDILRHLVKPTIDVGMEEKTIVKVYKILLFKDLSSVFVIFAFTDWLVH